MRRHSILVEKQKSIEDIQKEFDKNDLSAKEKKIMKRILQARKEITEDLTAMDTLKNKIMNSLRELKHTQGN